MSTTRRTTARPRTTQARPGPLPGTNKIERLASKYDRMANEIRQDCRNRPQPLKIAIELDRAATSLGLAATLILGYPAHATPTEWP